MTTRAQKLLEKYSSSIQSTSQSFESLLFRLAIRLRFMCFRRFTLGDQDKEIKIDHVVLVLVGIDVSGPISTEQKADKNLILEKRLPKWLKQQVGNVIHVWMIK